METIEDGTSMQSANGTNETVAENAEENAGTKKKKRRSRKKKNKTIDDGTNVQSANGTNQTVKENAEENAGTKKKTRRSRKKKNKTIDDGTNVQSANGANQAVKENAEASAQTRKKKKRGGNKWMLERCFGFFGCRNCKTQWTSAYTWRISDTLKVVFRQQCQRCHEYWFPWKNDYLTCSECGKKTPDCECPRRRRPRDAQKPHRSDLCEKCQSGSPCQGIEAEDHCQ